MRDDRPTGPSDEDLETTEAHQPPSGAPQRIGPYKILRELGEGGMGIVYLAEQEKPIRRRVALKIIKWGMDTKAVVARFEAERQALALMNHPNVAKVFDAGATDTGRPYFVMEYVKGVPITEHCDRQRLTTKERLRLFLQVCEGVQHAHQKAIIHRDLKPTNILVALEDNKTVPKIIDFGVAKATEHRLTERTLFTEMGQIIGTPEYMSPEQAEMTNQDTDTRTDVYSLGVILYELLVGALPFDPRELRAAGYDEIRRRIRQEEPSKPSTRVSTLGDASQESANKRRTDVRSLVRELRGDLDWICMKALEKDRARRYGSVRAIRDEIHKHLESRPVEAGPPSFMYRAGKLLRRERRRVAVGAGVLLSAVIIFVLGLSLWKVRSSSDSSRIRWTLEQVCATGTPPQAFEPEWDSLRRRLIEKILESPTGDLASLARRAATRMDSALAAFGLLSDAPSVDFEIALDPLDLLEPGPDRDAVRQVLSDWVFIADIDMSWDGEGWRTVKTHTGDAIGGQGFGILLTEFLDSTELSPGPHRLDIRSTVSFLDGAKLSETDRQRIRVDDVMNGPGASWLSQEERPTPLFREIWSLGSHPITLFLNYPESFPRAVSWDDSVGRLDRWFRLDHVRIFRVAPPRRTGRWLAYALDWIGPRREKVPDDLPPGMVWAAAVDIEGRWDAGIPVPVSAEASVILEQKTEPILSFALTLGQGDKLSSPGCNGSVGETGSQAMFFRHPEAPSRTFETTADGSYRGFVELRPSRTVALSTKRFDRYLRDTLRLPVDVTIETVASHWDDAPPSVMERAGRAGG